jgi:hypothetical protein
MEGSETVPSRLAIPFHRSAAIQECRSFCHPVDRKLVTALLEVNRPKGCGAERFSILLWGESTTAGWLFP